MNKPNTLKTIADFPQDVARLTNDELSDELNHAGFYAGEWNRAARRAKNINNKHAHLQKERELRGYIRELTRESDSRKPVVITVKQV